MKVILPILTVLVSGLPRDVLITDFNVPAYFLSTVHTASDSQCNLNSGVFSYLDQTPDPFGNVTAPAQCSYYNGGNGAQVYRSQRFVSQYDLIDYLPKGSRYVLAGVYSEGAVDCSNIHLEYQQRAWLISPHCLPVYYGSDWIYYSVSCANGTASVIPYDDANCSVLRPNGLTIKGSGCIAVNNGRYSTFMHVSCVSNQ